MIYVLAKHLRTIVVMYYEPFFVFCAFDHKPVGGVGAVCHKFRHETSTFPTSWKTRSQDYLQNNRTVAQEQNFAIKVILVLHVEHISIVIM